MRGTTEVDAQSVLARARDACNPVLREYVARVPEPLRGMAEYHFGWRDADGNPTEAMSGKGLRAALTLAVADALGADPAAATRAAAAVELVHNFTLVHDDLMDADNTRHGRPTAWRLWGSEAALLLGDVIHSLAIRIAVDLPASRAATAQLADTVVELCVGQFSDLSFEKRDHVTVDEYLGMVRGKTGILMGCACALGAICSESDAEIVSAFDAFGANLGVAFQCVDDVIGIVGDSAATGKPVGNDLIRRKKSLPVIAAMTSGGTAATRLTSMYRADDPMSADDVTTAVELVEKAGGVQYARQLAQKLEAEALAALPNELLTPALQALAVAAVHRDH